MTVGRNFFQALSLAVIVAGCGGGNGAGADGGGGGGGDAKQPAPGTCTMTFSGAVTQTEHCAAYILGETSGAEPSVGWVVDQGGMFSFSLTGMTEPFPGTYTTSNTNASTGRSVSAYTTFANQVSWVVNVNGGSIGPDQGEFSLQFASVAAKLPEGLNMLQGTFDATCLPSAINAPAGTTSMVQIHAVF